MDGFGGYTIVGNVTAALGVSREAQKVRVVHIFLSVGQLHHQAVAAANLVFGEHYAQISQPGAQRIASGMLADHQPMLGDAHRFRRDHLVGEWIFQDAVLVDAGFMRKGVRADYSLVRGTGTRVISDSNRLTA